MIARPGHWINAGEPAGATELPATPGVDLTGSVRRILAWGGDRGRYLRALGRALTAEPSLTSDASAVRGVAAVCGWRSGVLGLRADAVARLAAAGSGAGAMARALTAALELPSGTLAGFAAGQRENRFHWPGLRSAPVVLARLGGFTGLGGVWPAPPTGPVPIGPGRWRVFVGERAWSIECDLFAHRLAPDRDGLGRSTEQVDPTPGWADLAVSPCSYLATVHT